MPDNMKWKTIIFMAMLMISIVQGIDMCQDTVKPNTLCQMVSPSLTCPTSYYYSILNLSGTIIENATLTSLNSSTNTYYFNFNKTQGQYLVWLCDGTTREVYVESEDNNMLFGLILIPLVLGIMFLVASFLMSEEHTIIKIFFFGLSFLSATASLYMGSVGITYIDPADTAVQAAIGNMMLWVSWVDYIILIYIFIFVTIHILKALKQDKEEKLKY